MYILWSIISLLWALLWWPAATIYHWGMSLAFTATWWQMGAIFALLYALGYLVWGSRTLRVLYGIPAFLFIVALLAKGADAMYQDAPFPKWKSELEEVHNQYTYPVLGKYQVPKEELGAATTGLTQFQGYRRLTTENCAYLRRLDTRACEVTKAYKVPADFPNLRNYRNFWKSEQVTAKCAAYPLPRSSCAWPP